MSPSKRNKLLVGGGGALLLIVVALLVAPSFIDLDSYKVQIAAEVKKATGRDLVIDGPMSLSLLPTPSVSVTGVRFFNMPGAGNPTMVEVKSVTVRPSLLALVTGGLEVSEVILDQPKIVLEINAEGKPNWEFTPSVREARPAAPKPTSPKPLSLGALTFKDGTLIFSDSKAGISVVAEHANLTASVGSVDGPYGLAGSATVNGSPLTFDLEVGAKSNNGHAASVNLSGGGGRLAFKGNLSALGPDAHLSGTADVSADSLTTFVTTLLGMAGQPAPGLPPLLAGKFSFEGGIAASQTAFTARDFKVMLGQDSGSGSLAVTLEPVLAIDGKLSASRLDLDAWLAALSRPAAPATTKSAPVSPAPAGAKPGTGGSLLAALNAKLAIDVGEIVYHKQAVRDVALELEARGGAVAVPELSAILPGDMRVTAHSVLSGDAAHPTAAGEFSLVAPKLRETLKWLEVDVSPLPPDRLTRLSVKGRMASTNGEVRVPEAAIELDNLKATGGLTVTFSVPLSVVTHVQLDTFDLDAFLAASATGEKAPARAAPSPSTSTPPERKAPAGPSLGMKARIGKLIYKKQPISDVELDVALQGDTLRLNEIKVSNFATARFALRGIVSDFDTPDPRPDIAFDFDATDMTGVLKAAGVPAPANLGRVSASGSLWGSLERLALKDLAVTAMGESVKADGTLTMPGAAKGLPQSVGYRGNIVLNGQAIEAAVDARLTGRPNVTATLRTALLDLDKLRGASGGKPVPASGRPTAKAADEPIDTAALRTIDGTLTLEAATLVSAPLRLANANLAATLKDGVLTLSHFKAGLFGGTLDLSGVVNASQPALTFDIRGGAQNIYVGEMLRSMSGKNVFGGTVKITVDGKLNADSLALKGAGATAGQIKKSLSGGAQLGGHIYVGADKALTTLGTAATGIVGGVIDNTLGSALGIVGQTAGAGVSNMLNAASLILNRFVNRDNPVSGRIDISGGVLTDKGLVVQGDRATANVATRTDLASATTDTRVNFVIAEDTSAPYIVATVRGPLASPSYGVSRGSAKDPPGFVNTLEKGVTAPARTILPNVPVPNLPIPNIFGR
jgi:uncharacterized protein involved in outer membrane biogenesis